ncbi:MAG: hypothetical protein KAK00_07975 [Nanoarchaeota archaeon]|nr:hypothetical protein [Nanoarchaeota archaeon]
MLKKEVFSLVLIILFSATVYAEISGTVKLGETKHYITHDADITVSFLEKDSLTGRHSFIINNEKFDLFPFQKKEINGFDFSLIGVIGDSFDALQASFLIGGNAPFECAVHCEENFFVDFVKMFDSDFTFCKKDCDTGCGLYKEKKCMDNEFWIVDNCGNKTELVEKCDSECISGGCTDCGDGVCNFPENYFNCADCSTLPDFCISDGDCEEDNKCIYGECSTHDYIIGDGLCSLPYEDCSSLDCSCDSKGISFRGMDDYPIILIHGFASSAVRMKKLQRALSYDYGYKNGGEISIFDVGRPLTEKKTVYVATYYGDSMQSAKDKKGLHEILQKAYLKIINRVRGETTFVDIIPGLINRVKSCSDSDKVNIIAHSMGGLVMKNYLLKEDNIRNVNKIIFLGTPNHGGIYGEQTYKLFKGLEAPLGDRKMLLKSCSSGKIHSVVLSLIDGRDVSEECSQIQQAGSGSNPIWEIDETVGLVEYYTIAGNIDGKGDGVVPVESAALEGAVFNKVVSCNHFDLKYPSKCEGAYHSIIEALGYDPQISIEKKSILHTLSEFVLSIRDFFSEDVG